jgi:hypothetical protein
MYFFLRPIRQFIAFVKPFSGSASRVLCKETRRGFRMELIFPHLTNFISSRQDLLFEGSANPLMSKPHFLQQTSSHLGLSAI